MEAAGRTDTLAHLAARPEVCAVEAVGRAVAFAEWTGARLHIAHKSSKDALYILKDAKARGVDVTVETCPHYLLMSTDDTDRLGGQMRVNPPIREPGHAEALWEGLHNGTIDMIATDHAPHQPEETETPVNKTIRIDLTELHLVSSCFKVSSPNLGNSQVERGL